MLEPNCFLVELTENCGAEILPDGKVKTNRDQLEACATKFGGNLLVSFAKNFTHNTHVPTISVRRVEKKGKKTETEFLFFPYEDQNGDFVCDPSEWGHIPTQIFG
jgi:hypothetical protein